MHWGGIMRRKMCIGPAQICASAPRGGQSSPPCDDGRAVVDEVAMNGLVESGAGWEQNLAREFSPGPADVSLLDGEPVSQGKES